MRPRTLVLLLLAVALVAGALALPTVLPRTGPASEQDTTRTEPAEGEGRASGSGNTGEDAGAEGNRTGDDGAPAGDPVRPREAEAAETPGDPAAAAAPAEEPPPPPEISESLARRLRELADSRTVEEETVGMIVLAANGAPLMEENADEPLLPASTQKLVTAAAALQSLGPDFRYATTVMATAEPDDDGVIDGDLVLVGSGDPTLVTPTYARYVYPARPGTALQDLADQLADAGVTRVTGNVVGDATVFADEPVASGWLTDYFHSLDATRVSGLTVDAGRDIVERDGRMLAHVAERPAGVAAGALRDLLREAGVRIDGSAGTNSEPPDAPHELARVTSPPLSELLTFMVQRSDNHLADAIQRTVGRRVMGVGSWTAAAASALLVLDELGIDWSGAVVADGSGLSRDDRLTARQLAMLDLAMSDSEHGEVWETLMAVTGESGTLEGRLRGTLAERRLRAKTGTLRDVRSLAGAVVHPDGGRYYFAVVGNGLDGAGIQAIWTLQNDLVLALAEDLEGCERVPPDDEGPDELVCPD